MLEKLDLTKKMGKEEYKEKMEHLERSLGKLQRRCQELDIPVMIAFEGFGPPGLPGVCGEERDGGGEDASLPLAVLDQAAGKRPHRHLRYELVQARADRPF